MEANKGAGALPGKRPLEPAEAAAAGLGELGKGSLRPLVSAGRCTALRWEVLLTAAVQQTWRRVSCPARPARQR